MCECLRGRGDPEIRKEKTARTETSGTGWKVPERKIKNAFIEAADPYLIRLGCFFMIFQS
jgi:hypothetical protein